MLIRWQTTSPANEPSFRISTRSLAVRFPLTLPRITTSLALMLAWIWPLRPTVTRFPGRLMVPSTRPSMYSDSEPVTSPLITRDLPIVACSWLLTTALRGAAAGVGSLEKVGVVLITGFSGSGVVVVGFGFGLALWLGELAGFHIAENSFPVLVAARSQLFAAATCLWFLGGQPSGRWHVCDQIPGCPRHLQNCWIGAAFRGPCHVFRTAHTAISGCNYSRYVGISYIGRDT